MTDITLTFGISFAEGTVPQLSEQGCKDLLQDIAGVELTEQWIRNKADFHRYEGFDVMFVRGHWRQLGVSGTVPHEANAEPAQWTIAQLTANIRETIIIGLIFGNVTENNFVKRSAASQRVVTDLLQRCKLVQNVTPQNKKIAVTINRTMIAFANETVSISRFLGKNYTDGPGSRQLGSIPNYMKNTVFLSVCPTFDGPNVAVGVFLQQVHTMWSANMNLVINRRGATRRKRNFTDLEYRNSYADQIMYSDIAYSSNAFEGDRMKEDLVHWRINSENVYLVLKTIHDEDHRRVGIPAANVTLEMWQAAWS